MSDELGTRLARALGSLPGPSALAEARARRAALDALPAPARPAVRRGLLVAAAALVALLAAGAAGLAAIGRIHVVVGREQARVHVAPPRLLLPPGARGIEVVASGTLWLTTRGGTRIEGLPVTSAELSPRALYVAAGIGHALVVMRPDGHAAWTKPTRGPVEAIAWAPSGLRLAYVVRTASGSQLRTIEGDGDHDRLVDGAVRPVRPSWRADSLALAYVGAGGGAVVYDLAHRSRRVVDTTSCPGPISRLAFAPTGRRLALAGPSAVYAGRAAGGGARCVYLGATRVRGLAWAGGRVVYSVAGGAAADARTGLVSLAVTPSGDLTGGGFAGSASPVVALGETGARRLAIATRTGVELVDEPPVSGPGSAPLVLRNVLLRLRGVESLAVR